MLLGFSMNQTLFAMQSRVHKQEDETNYRQPLRNEEAKDLAPYEFNGNGDNRNAARSEFDAESLDSLGSDGRTVAGGNKTRINDRYKNWQEEKQNANALGDHNIELLKTAVSEIIYESDMLNALNLQDDKYKNKVNMLNRKLEEKQNKLNQEIEDNKEKIVKIKEDMTKNQIEIEEYQTKQTELEKEYNKLLKEEEENQESKHNASQYKNKDEMNRMQDELNKINLELTRLVMEEENYKSSMNALWEDNTRYNLEIKNITNNINELKELHNQEEFEVHKEKWIKTYGKKIDRKLNFIRYLLTGVLIESYREDDNMNEAFLINVDGDRLLIPHYVRTPEYTQKVIQVLSALVGVSNNITGDIIDYFKKMLSEVKEENLIRDDIKDRFDNIKKLLKILDNLKEMSLPLFVRNTEQQVMKENEEGEDGYVEERGEETPAGVSNIRGTYMMMYDSGANHESQRQSILNQGHFDDIGNSESNKKKERKSN